MEALQFNVSTPRAGKVLWAIYEPLFWSGLSCLHYGNRACGMTGPTAGRFWQREDRRAFRALRDGLSQSSEGGVCL